MANRTKKSRKNKRSVGLQKSSMLSKFVAFIVPFWFLSNLAGAVADSGFGLVRYHSYLVAFALFLILFLQSGQQRFILNRETIRFSLTHGFFMFVCLLSVLLVSGDSVALSQFLSYAWVSLLAIGFVTTFKYEQTMPCLLYTSPSPRDATLSRMPSSA